MYIYIKKYSEVKQKNMFKNKFQTNKVNKEQKVEWSGKNGLHRVVIYSSSIHLMLFSH